MQAVVLIGGRGTRLGALVDDCPKPLLPVDGKPFLDTLLFQLSRHGFTQCLLLAGYKLDLVRKHYGPNSGANDRFSMSIDILGEDEPLGTGGALLRAGEKLEESFLLLNGDSLFCFNYLDLFLSGPTEAPNTLARMALRYVSDARRYGLVDLEQGQVRAFREKPDKEQAGTVNAGVYWMHRDILDVMPSGRFSLENDVFPILLRQGRLAGRVYDGFFIDIGIPEDLERAEDALPAALKAPAFFFDRDNTLIEDKGYTHRPDQLVWLPEVPTMIKRLNDAGIYVFVITNQAGVAKGHYEEAQIRAFHRHMMLSLREIGAHIDAFRYCPHHQDGVVSHYAKPCHWRKPGPGMIEDLLAKWPVLKKKSVVFGDRDSDVSAGRAAGLKALQVETGHIVDAVNQSLLELKNAPNAMAQGAKSHA